MVLELYQNASDPRRVDKTDYLTLLKTVQNIKPFDSVGVLNAKFLLNYDGDVFNSNYCHCLETGRYYYIKEINVTTGNRIIIDCVVDVLHTFRNSIKSSPAWVELSSKNYDVEQDFLNNEYPFREDFETVGLDFPDNHFTQNGQNCVYMIFSP